MPTFLSDPSPTFYAILIILVAVLAGLYLRSRKRGELIRLLVGVAVLITVFLIDKLVESPREQATRKMEEIAKATQDKKLDDMFKHVSESFKYKEVDKKSLREKLNSIEQQQEFKGVVILECNRADFRIVDDKNVTVGLMAQARELPMTRSWIIAAFTKDADGEWRMSGFKRYDPMKQDRDNPQTIPGLD